MPEANKCFRQYRTKVEVPVFFNDAATITNLIKAMLEAHHSVVCDPSRNFVRMTIGGFFTIEDVETLSRVQRDCYRQLRCGPNRHLTLCDASGMKIQTQEVVGAFMRLSSDPATQGRRLAIVVGTSLARLQTQRVANRHNVQLFRDPAEAEAWLFAEPG